MSQRAPPPAMGSAENDTQSETAQFIGDVVARGADPAGGSIGNAVPAAAPENVGQDSDDARLMSEWAVRFNGRHYAYGNHRYDRLSDAVAYAQLVRERRLPGESDAAGSQDRSIEPPSAEERQLMALHAISFRAGVYEFAGYRYEHLKDALNYALLMAKPP